MGRSIISRIKRYLKVERKLKKKATFKGKYHKFSRYSRIFLEFGAKPENIIIEDNAWVEGTIQAMPQSSLVKMYG